MLEIGGDGDREADGGGDRETVRFPVSETIRVVRVIRCSVACLF